MVKSEAGFTPLEVIVATMLLSVGILGTARVSADMTRMLSQSDRMATAALHSQERIERLRAGGCDMVATGSDTKAGGYTLDWTVNQPDGARRKIVRLITSYPTGSGVRADTVETSVLCQ